MATILLLLSLTILVSSVTITNNDQLLFNMNSICGTRILEFKTGNYTLTPKNYRFAKTMTIEMWGGGVAGNPGNGHGGASGGYINVTIPTNWKIFYLSVGSGGNGIFVDGYMYTMGCSAYQQYKPTFWAIPMNRHFN